MTEEQPKEIIEVIENPSALLQHVDPSDLWDIALTHVLSENSRRVYKTSLKDFACYLLTRVNIQVPEDTEQILMKATPLLQHVKFQLITEYREHLRDNKKSANTINLRLAAIDALFKRMQRLELIKDNPASSVMVSRMKTSNISTTQGLSKEETETLIYSCAIDNSLKGIRDTALIAILIYTGIRRSEIASMNVEEIKFINETPSYTLTTKGDKRQTIEFIPLVWEKLNNWIESAKLSNGPIFRTIHKSKAGNEKILPRRLTTRGIYIIISNRAKAAKIKKRIHPHCLRHTYATLTLLAGVPIQEVQVSMGHASTNTTFRYYRAINQIGRSPGRSLNISWNNPAKFYLEEKEKEERKEESSDENREHKNV